MGVIIHLWYAPAQCITSTCLNGAHRRPTIYNRVMKNETKKSELKWGRPWIYIP